MWGTVQDKHGHEAFIMCMDLSLSLSLEMIIFLLPQYKWPDTPCMQSFQWREGTFGYIAVALEYYFMHAWNRVWQGRSLFLRLGCWKSYLAGDLCIHQSKTAFSMGTTLNMASLLLITITPWFHILTSFKGYHARIYLAIVRKIDFFD